MSSQEISENKILSDRIVKISETMNRTVTTICEPFDRVREEIDELQRMYIALLQVRNLEIDGLKQQLVVTREENAFQKQQLDKFLNKKPCDGCADPLELIIPSGGADNISDQDVVNSGE